MMSEMSEDVNNQSKLDMVKMAARKPWSIPKNTKKILFSLSIVFFVILTALRGAMFFWIDKQGIPMPSMPPWKIAVLKLSHNIPWLASPKEHLYRTLKLTTAILNTDSEIDHTLNGSLARMEEALDLLDKDERTHDLSEFPDLNFERIVAQASLMNRGGYFLVARGNLVVKGTMMFEKFKQLDLAYAKLENPSLEKQLRFGVEKMVRQIYFNQDIEQAKAIRDELKAKFPAVSEDVGKAEIDLYYGYALCLANNQDGASYIQTVNEKLHGDLTLTMILASLNWDFGYFAAIKKNNPAGSACVNSMMNALRKKI
jgi:hypothetical protein